MSERRRARHHVIEPVGRLVEYGTEGSIACPALNVLIGKSA